jgi:AcrR family transcriptional regulator
MSSSPTSVAERALEAALAVFSRYGFQRTSMADVAREAGISRAALYLHHKDKTALFQALTERVVAQTLAAARGAWRPDQPLADNLQATILAKDLRLYRLLHAAHHGAELLAACAAFSADSIECLDSDFAALLTERVAETPGLDLTAFDGPAGFGESLAAIAAGLKHEARTEAAYLASVDRLCRIVARAAGQS